MTADEGAGLHAELARLGADLSPATRGMYAYDASNYRVLPTAVAFPDSAEQIVRLLSVCADHSLPVTVRGGGTSMAGNAVGRGMVLDLSRRMNRVLEVDVEARTVTVEPGAVLDSVQEALAGHGLMVAPDPSSHSRATIGGMVGNDACGNHSVKYGRTVDHVISLDLVLADGCRVVAGAGGLRAHDPTDPRSTARAEHLNTRLRALVADHLADIRVELGRIARQVSGYQLQHLLPEAGFDAAKVLVGSEGTCAVVVGVTLGLVPVPERRILAVFGYDDMIDAATDVPRILRWKPAAVEGMDESIVATIRERQGADRVASLPRGRAWLLVELEGRDEAELVAEVGRLSEELRKNGLAVEGRIVNEIADRASIWHVRENGAGLATRRSDGTQTWAGWEDSAVSPDDLAGYLRQLRELMAHHGVTGAFYGHFGAGCVHVRMDFDLYSPAGIDRMRAFVVAAGRLVRDHGGSVSGEHGDGRSRSELLRTLYSPPIIHAFTELKRAFDPTGLLNPGIICDPVALDADLLTTGLTNRAERPRLNFAYDDDHDGFAGAVSRCVGIARCRSQAGGAMCPSYRATGQESASTRGRARVLQEMLRGDQITDGWRSEEVLGALDLCLSCKACSSECPVGVDMATYKSEFLSQHYRRRLRPRSHYSLGWLPVAARLAGRMPAVANHVLAWRVVRRFVAWAGGVSAQRALPWFHSHRTAERQLQTVGAVSGAATSAVLFVDTFTRAFRPQLVAAAGRVLADAAVSLDLAPPVCCGLTWISTGQLDRAKKVLGRTVSALDRSTGHIVVLEPSCATALAQDAPDLLGSAAARRVAERITTFSQILQQRADAGWRPPVVGGAAGVQIHCHERARVGDGPTMSILQRIGIDQVDSSETCCGLAGNFGFEAEHFATSIAVAEQSFRPMLETSSARQRVLADGFSCHLQAVHLQIPGAAEPVHLAELMDLALESGPRSGPGDEVEGTGRR